ncbi:hypothetical protein [Dongshaea marina]|uniref:hypothetical protein n=1 Tax=Dongshaea marina TaxID=2047966 RepID=UPI0018FFF5A0|nr:hypothetical protein [Dongshaea marina]
MWLRIAPLLFYIPMLWAAPQPLTLTLPAMKSQEHRYYYELLEKSLELEGVRLIIQQPYQHLPQKRIVQMLELGSLSLAWLIQTAERDASFTPVRTGLTDSLIGQRILLIPRGQQPAYNRIHTLDDLRDSGLIGGFGANWYDIRVWRYNRLPYHVKDGEWRALYQMLSATGGVNYFSRGLSEIVAEAQQHPNLEIEQRLVLVYDRDFQFYLSKQASSHQALLERALQKAKDSGLMRQLIEKYWQQSFKLLEPDKRLNLQLKTPPES